VGAHVRIRACVSVRARACACACMGVWKFYLRLLLETTVHVRGVTYKPLHTIVAVLLIWRAQHGSVFSGIFWIEMCFCTFKCRTERVVTSAEPFSFMFCFLLGLHCCFFFSVFASVLFICIIFLGQLLLLILSVCHSDH
jgi:hypothetical protein